MTQSMDVYCNRYGFFEPSFGKYAVVRGKSTKSLADEEGSYSSIPDSA